MLDYIASFLVRGVSFIFFFVPVRILLWCGRRIGTLAFMVNRKRRLVAYANLKAAFAGEKTPAELRALTKKVYQNLIQTFLEILSLTKVDQKYINTYVEVVNLERIQKAAKAGRGVILLTGHFGDWELSNLAAPFHGYPITVLAREQKMKRLNELLNRLRESKGCKVVRKGMSTKLILKALYNKEIVGILSDQDAGKNGTFVDFFGRSTSSHAGPFEMAKHTGAVILPNVIVRTKGPYHKLYLEKEIEFDPAKSDEDMRENLQKFMKMLETYVRAYPDQWLWLHKRWKSTPTRTVLVLSDGKAGHLHQALSLAREIQKARTTQGFGMGDTKVTVVEVRFRRRASKAFLGACAVFASWRCHGCMRCVKACLEKESYETLMKTYAEFIVSCGSGVAPVNIFMAKELNAKNIVVMKPRIFGWLKHFNLAVMPRHDRPPRHARVVETLLAPNLIDRSTVALDGERMRKHIALGMGEAVGVCVGGDNPEYALTKETIESVINGIVQFCQINGAWILVTTSRRTGKDVEDLLKTRLKDHPACKLLIIANEENPAGTLGGIMHLSKVVLVSADSVSMISEAITSGKKTVVFELEKKRSRATKHEEMVRALEDEGYVACTKAVDVCAVLTRAWNDLTPVKELRDRAKIFDAVRRLI